VTYTDVPNIYYGSRTSKRIPKEDVNYWGSPKTFKAWMDAHKATRVKTILATGFKSKEDVIEYENNLIERQWETNKPISLNAAISGKKFNSLGVPAWNKGKNSTPEHAQKISAALKGRTLDNDRRKIKLENQAKELVYFIGVPPEGEPVIFINVKKFCRDNPDWNFSVAL
jgi:hypothetical protein